jgi:competence protein ComEA
VLLILVAAGGVGLAVGHWGRARPELVERLERFDQDAPEASSSAAAVTARRGRELARPVPPPSVADLPEATAATSASSTPTPPASEAPAVPPVPSPLDLNQATLAELVRLPGVGPALAARIVLAREVDGPFASVDDLRRVRGLRRATFERLRALVTVAP